MWCSWTLLTVCFWCGSARSSVPWISCKPAAGWRECIGFKCDLARLSVVFGRHMMSGYHSSVILTDVMLNAYIHPIGVSKWWPSNSIIHFHLLVEILYEGMSPCLLFSHSVIQFIQERQDYMFDFSLLLTNFRSNILVSYHLPKMTFFNYYYYFHESLWTCRFLPYLMGFWSIATIIVIEDQIVLSLASRSLFQLTPLSLSSTGNNIINGLHLSLGCYFFSYSVCLKPGL